MNNLGEDIVLEVLKKLFPSKTEYFNKSYYDIPIVAPPFYFGIIDLMYIYISIEKKLGHKLTIEKNTDFFTIESIIQFVNDKLEKLAYVHHKDK